jgi:hypothetical protein
MVKRLLLGLTAALLLASILTLQPARADTDIYFRNGQGAQASFYAWDEAGCQWIGIHINIVEEVYRSNTYQGRETSERGVLYLNGGDVCQGTMQHSAIGWISSNDFFTIDPSLKTANFQYSGRVYDLLQDDLVDLDVSINWSGYGPRWHDRYPDKPNTGPCGMKQSEKISYRAAVASSFVSINGQVVNFSLPESAYLFDSNYKDMWMSCNLGD